jgi:hypothetical protein
MREDFRDIRFSDQFGNPLSHQRESYASFSTAKYWIKLPADDSNILMFYGNGGATTASSGPETFEYYEYFSSINLSKWAIEHGAAIVSNGILTVYHKTLNSILQSSQTFSQNTIVEVRACHSVGNRSIMGYRDTDSQKSAAWHGAVIGDNDDHLYTHNGSSGTWDDDDVDRGGTAYHIYGVAYLSAGPKYWVDYKYRGQVTTTIPSGNLPIHFYSEAGKTVKVDWVRVRKYAAVEPTLKLGRKFVQNPYRYLQQRDYISDVITTYGSVGSHVKDIITDSIETTGSVGSYIGAPDTISDDITTIGSTSDTLTEKTEIRDYSLVSCDISKSTTDAYLQLSAEFADTNVPAEDSTIKHYAHLGDDTTKLLFWGKVVTNSPTLGGYYSTLQMQGADASRNLAIQKIPWIYQVISLSGSQFTTWSKWIAALVDFSKTGVKPHNIYETRESYTPPISDVVEGYIWTTSEGDIATTLEGDYIITGDSHDEVTDGGTVTDTGMPDKQFVMKPETTRLEAIKQICEYCELVINIKLVTTPILLAPYFLTTPYFSAVPASEIDQPSGGFDLPNPIIFENPSDSTIATQPKIEGFPEEKYNMVTVYGTITSTGLTTVASVYTPDVANGKRANEYCVVDNSIEEKSSTAEIEAIKKLLYFQSPRATVSMKLINRFDLELYQRIRFGSKFPRDLQDLTNSQQLSYVIAFDPREEANSKHTVDVSGVPRPAWLRISDIKYHSEKLIETVELKLITDYIYSSVDTTVSTPYSQYISPGYLKPVSDDSTSNVQDIVDNTIEKQLTLELGTLISINTETKTGVIQTASGKLITVTLSWL